MEELKPWQIKKKEESANRKAVLRMDHANMMYEALQKVDRAYKLVWFERARILKEFKEHKLYRYIAGQGYKTWEEFCSDPSVGMSRVTANLHVGLYEYFVERLNFGEKEMGDIPIGRLQRMVQLGIDKMEAEEIGVVIAEAKLLSDRDFYKSLAERTGNELPKRPTLYFDAGMQKWVFKFDPKYMGKIVDETEDKVIWQHI